MDSMRRRSSWPRIPEKPSEWAAVEKAIAGMSREQLLAELSRIGGGLESRQRTTMSDLLSSMTSDLDRPVGHDQPSMRKDDPSRPADRGRASSQSSRPSPPGALDLLITGRRIGPRLASRLVRTSAAAARRRRSRGV